MGWVSLHVRTCRPRFCISGTAWPIEFNFGVWVGGHQLGAYHKSWVGYLCTCARAHRASVSQKRLDWLCSNLVCGLGVTKYVLSTSQGWGGASLHVRTCTPSPYLRIRVANCAKVWFVAGDPIVTRFTRVGGGVTAHSHVRLQFRCLGNRWVLTLKRHQKQAYLSLSRSLVHRQTWRLTGCISDMLLTNKHHYSATMSFGSFRFSTYFENGEQNKCFSSSDLQLWIFC